MCRFFVFVKKMVKFFHFGELENMKTFLVQQKDNAFLGEGKMVPFFWEVKEKITPFLGKDNGGACFLERQ